MGRNAEGLPHKEMRGAKVAKQFEADVVVVGAGLTGTTIARELSRYKVETVVVERCGHEGCGQTKASFGTIYSGLPLLQSFILKSTMAPDAPLYDANSHRIRWLEQGFDMMPQWLEELDVQHQYLKALVVATSQEEVKDLESLVRFGGGIGGRYAGLRWADRKTCFEMEPHLTKDVVAGVYSGEGELMQVPPWEMAIAQSDNAKQNGVKVILNAEVTGVSQKNGYQLVETTRGPIKTRFIVNAAGISADVVADMGGARDWGLHFVRGLLILLDKRVGGLVRNFTTLPMHPGIGVGAIPTLDGNVLVNVSIYKPLMDRYDLGEHPGERMANLTEAKKLIPEISEKDVIHTFVGMRAFNTRDLEENIIEPSSTNPRFINVAVRLPGISCILPIARHVVALLGDAGLELVTKRDFNPYRKAIPRFRDLPSGERNKLIAQDPRYGHVVCRCETVTEGEIVEAIKRGAVTVAGVKYRTRAGMGRCQGGFCGPRVVNILARELNIPANQVMDLGVNSPVVPYQRKELLPA
jgi:glycerol-3-phosphate dehydrogenase